MTEEIKTCDCKQKCIRKIKKFVFLSGAIFVGTTLAILVSASILRPKCPPPMMMGPRHGIERPMQPHMMPHDFDRAMHRPGRPFPPEARRHHAPHKIKAPKNLQDNNFQPPEPKEQGNTKK